MRHHPQVGFLHAGQVLALGHDASGDAFHIQIATARIWCEIRLHQYPQVFRLALEYLQRLGSVTGSDDSLDEGGDDRALDITGFFAIARRHRLLQVFAVEDDLRQISIYLTIEAQHSTESRDGISRPCVRERLGKRVSRGRTTWIEMLYDDGGGLIEVTGRLHRGSQIQIVVEGKPALPVELLRTCQARLAGVYTDIHRSILVRIFAISQLAAASDKPWGIVAGKL